MIAATRATQRPADAKLLVVDALPPGLLAAAPCDVAYVPAERPFEPHSPVLVPFGGGRDENGNVLNTDGSFHAGVDGAQPGVFMQRHPQIGRDFRESIGAARMARAGHHGLTAEGLHGLQDPVVICGDDDRRDAAGFQGAAVHVLDHRLPCQARQRLTGETCRLVSCRDDDGTGEQI